MVEAKLLSFLRCRVEVLKRRFPACTFRASEVLGKRVSYVCGDIDCLDGGERQYDVGCGILIHAGGGRREEDAALRSAIEEVRSALVELEGKTRTG